MLNWVALIRLSAILIIGNLVLNDCRDLLWLSCLSAAYSLAVEIIMDVFYFSLHIFFLPSFASYVMSILFVHDHKFKVCGSAFFSTGSFPCNIWQRYLSVFENLMVVGRNGGFIASGEKGYTLSSAERVEFKLLPNISNLKSLFIGNKFAMQECRRLVASHDAVIARLPSRLGQLFVAEAIRQGKPYAVEVVACPWDALWNYGNWKGKLLAPFAALKLRMTVAKSPFTLYVTRGFLQSRYPCPKGLTTFCSNVEISSVDDTVLSARLNRSDASSKKLKFGLIGNYSSRYKGIDIAIRALAMSDLNLPDWEFEILGAGDSDFYTQMAAELGVEDKVKFIGSKASGQPVFDWLDGVDIYLQPSFQEGLPRALIEAMSRGCPALATAIAGIPELLQSSEMVVAGDYVSLSHKINALVSDKERRINLAEQNFKNAKGYYKDILDSRRTEFWLAFRDSIKVLN